MTQPLHTLCICGGGNLGHTLIGYISAKAGYGLNLLTSRPEAWAHELIVQDCQGNTFTGKPEIISARAADVIPVSDFVLLCVPGYALREELQKIAPWLKPGTKVGSVVSSTGFFFLARQYLPASIELFGFHRVPFISRIDTYGKQASLLGYKKELKVAIENSHQPEEIVTTLSDMLDTPIVTAGHFLEVTLSNSNPLLHTSRIYQLFRDYREGVFCNENFLFYEGWTDEDSELLLKCDEEFFGIIRKLPIAPETITPLLTYYECRDASSLTQKIKSIEAFKGLKSPMKPVGDKYIPDFDNRYFREDFNYGLALLQQIADKVQVETPCMTRILDWATKFIPISRTDFRITF